MSRLLHAADLHLGDPNIHNYRDQFSSAEEHHEVIFDNLASNVHKQDTLVLLGDIALTPEWNERLQTINCRKKILVMGNHDTDRKVHVRDLINTYKDIHALWNNRNCIYSHCAIHPDEFRNKILNIHGHGHERKIAGPGYFSVSLENIDYKPITFAEIMERADTLGPIWPYK